MSGPRFVARFPRLPTFRAATAGGALPVTVYAARGFVARLCGLLGARPLARDEALLIEPCASVHTLGMRYPIDAVFLDLQQNVVAVRERVAPNRFVGARRGRSVLEMPAGRARELGLVPGMRVDLVESVA